MLPDEVNHAEEGEMKVTRQLCKSMAARDKRLGNFSQ